MPTTFGGREKTTAVKENCNGENERNTVVRMQNAEHEARLLRSMDAFSVLCCFELVAADMLAKYEGTQWKFRFTLITEPNKNHRLRAKGASANASSRNNGEAEGRAGGRARTIPSIYRIAYIVALCMVFYHCSLHIYYSSMEAFQNTLPLPSQRMLPSSSLAYLSLLSGPLSTFASEAVFRHLG